MFIPLALQLASCSYAILGTGHLKIVDHDCRPIKNKSVQVNNIYTGSYLNSGHLTKERYVTDNNGLVRFDIEKDANKLVILFPDTKGKKRTGWNWYTTTSDDDEILFLFDKSISNVKTNYKRELVKTSVDHPLVITYPYQKDKCNNNNAELDKYNLLKREADTKAKKSVAEKARIAAIKVVIPKYKIKAYGIINNYIGSKEPGRAHYTISKNTNFIGKGQQNLYTLFGIFVTASDAAVLYYCSDITYNIIYPKPGLTDPSSGKTIKYHSIDYCEKHRDRDSANPTTREFMMSMQFSSPWQIKSGVWVFQIKYKDSILLEQSFNVE